MPDGFEARLAVPRAREEAAQLREGADHVTERRGQSGRAAVELQGVNRLPLARLKHRLTRSLGLGPAHHCYSVDTPSDDEINCDRIEEAMITH